MAQAEWDVEHSDREKLFDELTGLEGSIAASEIKVQNFEGTKVKLTTEIDNMRTMFAKEIDAAHAQEVDLTEAISALKSAVVVLKKNSRAEKVAAEEEDAGTTSTSTDG